MNTDVGTESIYSLSEALQLLEGLKSALELDGHRALVDPSALLGMLGLLCWEQLLCPRGFRSLVGTFVRFLLLPPYLSRLASICPPQWDGFCLLPKA